MDSKLRCVFELPEDKKVQSKIVAQLKSDQNTSSGNEVTQECGIGEDKVIALLLSSSIQQIIISPKWILQFSNIRLPIENT